jgi:hypothetical protein
MCDLNPSSTRPRPNIRRVSVRRNPFIFIAFLVVLIASLPQSGCLSLSGSLTPSQTNLSFGNVAIGSSSNQSLTFRNSGTAPFTITKAVASGGGFTVTGPSLPLTLAVGQSTTFMARFAPSAIGSASGSLLITSAQETMPQLTSGSGSATPSIATEQKTIAMAGTGVSAAPSITTQPASQTVTAGQTATFSVTGSGAAPLSYQWRKDGTAISGATAATYTTPATTTSDNGGLFAVALSNNVGSLTSTTAALTVSSAFVGQLTASTATLSFGEVKIGTSGSQTVTVSNTGNATLHITEINVTGTGFRSSSLVLPLTLNVGQSASLGEKFEPTAAGNMSGVLSVLSDVPNSPTTIALSGTGVAGVPFLKVNPPSLAFGDVAVNSISSQMITLSNAGKTNLTILKTAITGSGFSNSGLATPLTLLPSQSSTFTARFKPISFGNFTGNISFVTNDPNSTMAVALLGSGVAPALSIDPGSLSFGNVNVDSSVTQTITLTNTGNATLALSQANMSGTGFSLSALFLSMALAPGQSTSFGVNFSPQAVGSAMGSISLISNAPTSPSTIMLTGGGLGSALAGGGDPLAIQLKPSIDTNPSDYPDNIWVTDGMSKVRQDSGSPGTVKWSILYAAQNEFESFQIHEQAGASPVILNNVAVSDLVNAQTGTHIPASTNIFVYREAYLNITSPSDVYATTGYYPDILIPTVDPYYKQARTAFPVTIAANQNQSIWIDVLVPTTAPSGYYVGTATVTNGGATYARLPILLAVWNFSLPSTPTLVTSYSAENTGMCLQAYGSLAGCSVFPGAGGSSTTAQELTSVDEAKLLLDHRMTKADVVELAPTTNDFTHFDSMYGALMNGTANTILSGAKLTSIYYLPGGISINTTNLQWWVTHFNANRWLPRLSAYTCDEPPSGCNWSDLQTAHSSTQAVTPSVPTLVASPSIQRMINQGVLADDAYMNIFAPTIYDMESRTVTNQRSRYNTWLTSGGTRVLWMYQSCGSSGGPNNGGACVKNLQGDSTSTWPSAFIDSAPVRNRIFEWMSYLYNVSGELYWDIDFCWEFTTDKCTSAGDSSTLNDPWISDYFLGNNGDGTLIYPGTQAKIGGTTPVPIPSIRLKLIRDGIEDYEYLIKLTNLGLGNFATATANVFITNAYTFSNTSGDLQAARLALGNKLHAIAVNANAGSQTPLSK